MLQRLALICLPALLLATSCASPITVERINPRDVHHELTSNVISTGELSSPTQIVLQRRDLLALFASNPAAALANLHHSITTDAADPNALFALAEASFKYAEASRQRAYYLAAVVYSYAFLFPDDATQRPSAFDPRFRTACDLYNRGLTSAFASDDRARVLLQAGKFTVPFGSIDIAYDNEAIRWGALPLSSFTPTDELRITGLKNRYRQRGIGAPLAADAVRTEQQNDFDVAPNVKVPVTAVLRLDASRSALASGALRGRIDVYPAFEPSSVQIGGQTVPLEVDTSAAFAYGLSDPQIWRSEFGGFLQGDFFDEGHSPLDGLEPYRPGQIPVIFIHGTGSSAGRWANLVNDLQGYPAIREHFQFWWFSYSSGNPSPISALRLRTAIEQAVKKLDPQGRDPALRQIVLIGHSQGGLLAKLLTIDSGSRLWDAISNTPLDSLNVSEATRDMLRRAAFVTPEPDVRRVIFIATPQRGSFVAGSTIGQLLGRLVSLPIGLLSAIGEVVSGNPDALRIMPGKAGFSSVFSMTPGNPALDVLASIPVSPNVAAHSIIAVRGDGPVEQGDDGVVTYQSAHIAEAQSELVIRAGHSVQAEPQTVSEVRRILLLHLAQACPDGCIPK